MNLLKKVKEWIEGSDKPTIMSFVSVPIREMRSLWHVENEEIQDAKREVQRETSRKIMQKVYEMASKRGTRSAPPFVDEVIFVIVASFCYLFCKN